MGLLFRGLVWRMPNVSAAIESEICCRITSAQDLSRPYRTLNQRLSELGVIVRGAIDTTAEI
jgi:hypothetical protein